MPRLQNLRQSQVDRLRDTGRHAVAPGLYLTITDTGLRQYWTRRSDEHGRRRWLVLGDAGAMTLNEARSLSDGAPVARTTETKGRTFAEAGADYIATHRKGWRSELYAGQWQYTVEELCRPLHGLLTDRIKADEVAAVLRRIEDRPETLRRCRSRIAMVIDYELARLGRLEVVNPADLRLQARLVAGLSKRAARRKRFAVRHHPAPTLEQVRALWGALGWTLSSHLALRWILLTVARTTETRFAPWGEINRPRRIWTLPAERTKSERPHIVPLSDQALVVLAAAHRRWPKARAADLLFPGREGVPLNLNTQRFVMQGVLGADVTPHGIRAAFRSWVRDTGRDETLAELALAHAVDDETVAAYARTDALERRRGLMDEWAAIVCGDQPGNVVPLVAR